MVKIAGNGEYVVHDEEVRSLLKGTYSKQFIGVVQHTPGHWFALKHGSYNNANAFVRVCSLVDSNLDYVWWNDIEDHISANFRQERRGTQKDNSIVIFSGKTTNTGFQKGVKKPNARSRYRRILQIHACGMHT